MQKQNKKKKKRKEKKKEKKNNTKNVFLTNPTMSTHSTNVSAKGNTVLDTKSAHPLLFNTRKQGHCTAISPGVTFTGHYSCIKSIFHILVHVSHLGRADSISNPVFAFFNLFDFLRQYLF